MVYSGTINLGVISEDIKLVSVQTCSENCENCVTLNGYFDVPVTNFPLVINGIPDTTKYIKLLAGTCSAQCIPITLPTTTLPPITLPPTTEPPITLPPTTEPPTITPPSVMLIWGDTNNTLNRICNQPSCTFTVKTSIEKNGKIIVRYEVLRSINNGLTWSSLINGLNDPLTFGDTIDDNRSIVYRLVIKDSDGVIYQSNQLRYKHQNCAMPIINDAYVSGGKLAFDYTILGSYTTPNYEIATDIEFNNIVKSRVGYTYTQVEVTSLITSPLIYYIRVKNICSPTESEWSEIYIFDNRLSPPQTPGYSFVANIIPGNYDTPIIPFGGGICYIGNNFTKPIRISTPNIVLGSRIYLSDGVTPAKIDNMSTFGSEYNVYGIRWIRASTSNKIYNVDPYTGIVVSVSSLTC